MINLKNVHIGYPNNILFKIGELNLIPGTVYILVGKNGCGKSTFLRTLVKQEKLINGQITINNQSITNADLHFISKNISYVSSSFPQVEYLTVFEYIKLGRAPYTNALGRLSNNDEQIVNRAIDTLALNNLRDKFTNELSDGERQLVALAKALAQETSLIVLDEPTAFLDYSNKKMVLNILKKIATDLNKCIILSSHDIDLSVEANCPFLVLSMNKNILQEFYPPINKEEILKTAFDWI